MRSLVVYESWFGNTQHIAERIALALQEEGQVELLSVDDPVPPLDDFDLLVVGAPTHVHGLSGKRSREAALEQGGSGEIGIGVRGFIAELPNGARARASRSSTRARTSRSCSSARRQGASPGGCATTATSSPWSPRASSSTGTPGPLEEGELERAMEWGKKLANGVMSPTA